MKQPTNNFLTPAAGLPRLPRAAALAVAVAASLALLAGCVPMQAKFEDAGAVPYLHSEDHAYYAQFLAAPGHRAFAISPLGFVGIASNAQSESEAQSAALKACDEQSAKPCLVYAVNARVVWEPDERAVDSRVRAVPYLTNPGKVRYESFLHKPWHRAFAISTTGSFGWAWGQTNVESATESAIKACQNYSKGVPCEVYMLNDEVVWNREPTDATVADVEAVPTLEYPGRLAYKAFLEKTWNRAFALSPEGNYGWSWGQESEDQALDLALEGCNRWAKSPCKIYAVNDAVVWEEDEIETKTGRRWTSRPWGTRSRSSKAEKIEPKDMLPPPDPFASGTRLPREVMNEELAVDRKRILNVPAGRSAEAGGGS